MLHKSPLDFEKGFLKTEFIEKLRDLTYTQGDILEQKAFKLS